ncbi:MAG: TMEM165/GDT1 family protein [Candidatus Bathyarchaeia archaeon]
MATVASAVFVAELTDKDALLILTLATRHRSWFVFAAGSVTFTITTAIIAVSGYFLVNVFPVYWIKIVGGVIMIGYGLWGFLKVSKKELAEEEEKLLARTSMKSMWPAFLAAVSMLALLDLTGDATEVLIIVFVAHFNNVVLVFVSALIALIAATAIETAVGNRLRNHLSLERLRLFSLLVFTIIGTAIIIATIL